MGTENTTKMFVVLRGIKLTAEREESNPNNPEWRDADHWCTVLRLGRKRMTVHFSMGEAHKGKPPKAEDVLDCLASDSSSVENARTFQEWATDLGFSEDSRKAERTFKLCERQAARLKAFLGDEGYDALLYRTERL